MPNYLTKISQRVIKLTQPRKESEDFQIKNLVIGVRYYDIQLINDIMGVSFTYTLSSTIKSSIQRIISGE